jgi:hypothetical protein
MEAQVAVPSNPEKGSDAKKRIARSAFYLSSLDAMSCTMRRNV